MSQHELRRNGAGYPDPTAHAVLTALELPEFKPKALVYICSPYRGEITANVRLARAFSAAAIDLGYAPVAPHLLYPQFMDDDNPRQRQQAFAINQLILTACSQLWVYQPRITAGMSQEIGWAKQAGKPIRYFNQDFEEVTK